MIGKCGIRPEDARDVEQELFIHLIAGRDHYDHSHESGATPEQFASFILDKVLSKILEARRRNKRAIHINCLSLDFELKNEDGEPTPLGTLIDDEAPSLLNGRSRLNESTDLRMDVERMLANLSAPQREIGNLLLQGYKASEISRRMGRSRAALDREIEKMKRTLYESGLRDYLGPVNSQENAVEG